MELFYEWRSGDHVCEVASIFGLTCKELIEMNHLTNIDDLKTGDIIIVRIGKHKIRKEEK